MLTKAMKIEADSKRRAERSGDGDALIPATLGMLQFQQPQD